MDKETGGQRAGKCKLLKSLFKAAGLNPCQTAAGAKEISFNAATDTFLAAHIHMYIFLFASLALLRT